MDIQLTCRHCELSDKTRDYAATKIDRVLKHFDGVHSVEMILSREGDSMKVELIVATVRATRLVAADSAPEAHAAIDLAIDKLDRQIQKLKGKLRDRHA